MSFNISYKCLPMYNILNYLRANYKKLEKDIKEMSAEKDVCWKQMKEFESEVAELKLQYTLLHANHEKTIVENAETVRNMKVIICSHKLQWL